MSDEQPKKVLSTPPPPTDEIDSEWAGEEKPKTVTAAAEAGTTTATDSGSPEANEQLKAELAGQNETAASPGTAPPPTVEEEEDDEDEEEEEDDEEDEDEEEEEHAHAHASHAPVTRSSRPAPADDWIPEWAPFAVLGLLVLLGVIGGLGAFTKHAEGEEKAAAAPSASAQANANAPTSIQASHFLVQYQGSMRAAPTVTRTKEEAKKRAEEGLAKVKKGDDFAKIVGEYSDEPGAGARGGDLGEFTRERMIKPFSDAAFALKVGQVSGVVETPFGFHVIKRTK